MFRLDWDGCSHTIRHSVSHRKYWSNVVSEYNLLLTTDRQRITAPVPTFPVITDSFGGSSKFSEPSQSNVYTDGSKTQDG